MMLMDNLRVCPCDALRERVKGGEKRRNVVEKEGLLSLCKPAEGGDGVVRQVGAGRCEIERGVRGAVDVGYNELDAVL